VNIFLMVLVFLFMAGYYFLDSPSQRVQNQEVQTAVRRADLRAIAECTASAHTAAMKNMDFPDVCVQQYHIVTKSICLNSSQNITKCEVVRNKKPEYSFLLTHTAPIEPDSYNSMLELLEQYYPNAGTFGIFMDDGVVSGGLSGKRPVPKKIVAEENLEQGDLVFLTQYEIPDDMVEYIAAEDIGINCPAGTTKTYRFNRWQCVGLNAKYSCSGDMIWDSDTGECVADQSRKPLCASAQSAVMVDDIWMCVDPFQDRTCPKNMVAHLNYNTLEWECIQDPGAIKNTTKCQIIRGAVYGAIGSTLRVPTNSCTDCETQLIDQDTCTAVCIPDPAKISDSRCYPDARECSGPSRAFYFGFPTIEYAANVAAVANINIPMDATHSRNRKFNCMDCGAGTINSEESMAPYVAVCNE
jgi:hypothetical protein